MTDADVRDAGFDDLLDAVEAGEGYYLECGNGHGSLPPRRACPRCGNTDRVVRNSLRLCRRKSLVSALELPNTRRCAENSYARPYELAERPLDDHGEVVTFTVVHVPTPEFDDAPYVTAIADFGQVRLTGVVRGTEPEAVELGQTVEPVVEESATTGERLLVFRPTAA